MINHLKATSTLMYRLYVVMKERPPEQITKDEITIASGQKILDPATASELLGKLESANENIRHAFEKQAEAAAVSHQFIYGR
jgi:hypothetical protein